MPPEEDRATATGELHKTFCADQSSSFRDTLADRQTHTQTDRQTDQNTPLPYRGGVKSQLEVNSAYEVLSV